MKNRAPTKLPVPAFTPVPRRKPRHDGWTAERQRAFLDALAETGSVKHAAARINMAAEGAYALRRQPGAESFCKAWDAALDHGAQRLRDIAIDRAIDGVEVPVYSYGKLVGTRRVFNDKLLMFNIKHRLGRLGADDPNPLRPGTKSAETQAREMAALKEQWFDEQQEALAKTIETEANALAAMAEALLHLVRRGAQAREAGEFELEDRYDAIAQQLIGALRLDPGEWEMYRGIWEAIHGSIASLPERFHSSFGAAGTLPGPTWRERDHGREESKRLIARGRAMWIAATSEDAWAEFKKKEAAPPDTASVRSL